MPSGHRVNEAEARLREWLEATAPKRGTRLPSERALALQLGLQHYALNRAMGRLIIEGSIERDGYKLSVAGTALARPSFSCHLVIAQRSIYLPSYRRVAKEMGIKLVVHPWQSTDEAILRLEKLDVRETEAVVFDPPYGAPRSVWEPVANTLCKHGIPVVCFGQTVPNLFSVLADNIQSLQLAILRLIELGHREIGLVTAPPTSPVSTEVIQGWNELCLKHGLSSSARRIHLQNNMRLREEADDVAGLLVGEWSQITALVVFTMPDCNIQLLQDQLVHKGRHIPGDLSLLFIGDGKIASVATPSITSVSADMAVLQETAFFLAHRAARKKKSLGILPPPCDILVQPQLITRQSTRPVISSDKQSRAHPNAVDAAPPATISQPKPSVEITAALESSLRKAYPLAARAFLSERPRFAPVDLGPHVNRPLNFRRGWLGDLPLKQLSPGSHEIHGVPFQILGGSKRSDCGTIVFHSAVNTTGNAQKLPDKLKIPIGSKAQAIYILHGCGYAKFRHTFAHYSFQNRTVCLDRIPLVSLGQPPSDYNPEQDAKTASPNIQDWWPDFPHTHTDFPHARMAPILDNDNTGHASRYVYLYTLEWINPEPETVVSHLEITVDSTHSTTLGMLAVTVLKP